MPTMRVTWEAKFQLQQILSNCGFPEESLSPLAMETVGPDPKLDVIMAFMCYGLYPNVCFHKDKRKVLLWLNFFAKYLNVVVFKGFNNREQSSPNSQNFSELQQLRAKLPLSILRVRRKNPYQSGIVQANVDGDAHPPPAVRFEEGGLDRRSGSIGQLDQFEHGASSGFADRRSASRFGESRRADIAGTRTDYGLERDRSKGIQIPDCAKTCLIFMFYFRW